MLYELYLYSSWDFLRPLVQKLLWPLQFGSWGLGQSGLCWTCWHALSTLPSLMHGLNRQQNCSSAHQGSLGNSDACKQVTSINWCIAKTSWSVNVLFDWLAYQAIIPRNFKQPSAVVKADKVGWASVNSEVGRVLGPAWLQLSHHSLQGKGLMMDTIFYYVVLSTNNKLKHHDSWCIDYF